MKKKQWMEKAIRYDMLKQLYQGDALTAKALKAVFEDAEPVADDVKKEAKAEVKECLPEAAPVIEVTPEAVAEIPSISQEQVEDAKQTAEKYKKPRKKIDHGKVKALASAGWSAKEIAAEMHCAEVTIYKILHSLEEKNE